MGFQKAERKRAFVKVALTGPSGSGKTYSALLVAFGLAPGGKVAMLDSENGSGSMYCDLGEYDVCEVSPPFTTEKYEKAIEEAVAGGYDVLVIDSISHAWAGAGGLLEQKDALDGSGRARQFQNWGPIGRQQDHFIAAILHAPIHIIATMRAKQGYEVGADGKVTKLGLAPVQREGVDYEFTTVFDLARNHVATSSKDRTGLFDKLAAPLSQAHGKALSEWLTGGAPVRIPDELQSVSNHQPSTPPASRVPDHQHDLAYWRRRAMALYTELDGDPQNKDACRADIAKDLGIEPGSRTQLTAEQWEKWAGILEKQKDAQDRLIAEAKDEGPEAESPRALDAVKAGEEGTYAEMAIRNAAGSAQRAGL